MAFKTWSPFDQITSSDVNTYLMQQAFIVCTVPTRPSSPVTGMRIWQTDTKEEYYWSGSSWVLFKEAPKFIVKSVDEIKNNTDDPDLDSELFCEVRATALYMMDIFIIYAATASANINVQIQYPPGAIINWSTYLAAVGTVDRDHVVLTSSANWTPGQPRGQLAFGASSNAILWIRDLSINVGSTPGVVGLKWSQVTAENSNTTVRVNSYLHVRRIVT